ncbi:TPA: hypothetical protein N2696_003039 [Vibrio parahaemolyticus]|uniref:Uncharacterized protein n=1 Tax=Vibrio ordalii FS-238 TaxID=617133 RepID=A0A853R321_9VIBR|nr:MULTISPECIES: hypothetical protein [Vibrio]EGQ7894709.1 hypothetical protein [Vibrio parahaemolyticus]EGQ8477069.1 hypothetical protein [Vibrio parahaemolyticus]EGR1279903.1 hypothetical protein [Vibrio parahaemolyticus]EGR1791080.1 hypothetical protein [Vibrio parahaemolyticus]EGR1936725.1 hypothetical protein [Vibrio parahaemolyticus]
MDITLKEDAVIIYDPASGLECTMSPQKFRRKILSGSKIRMRTFPVPAYVQVPYEDVSDVIKAIEEHS